MGSPTLTVSVLLVLWLIVIVPMIFRRHDAGAQERSVQRFGQAMRSLSRRTTVFGGASSRPLARAADPEDATYVRPAIDTEREELFVTGTRPAKNPASTAVRRPVPAAQEALMYPVERSEMSAARQHMMARRRRSLSILGGGSFLMLMLALVVGGGLFWTAAVFFLLGLGGYLYFLRSHALRDRERRANRQDRHSVGRLHSYDATEREEYFAEPPASVVRIDDDDLALHNLDTIDLTGLYSEELAESLAQRRAS